MTKDDLTPNKQEDAPPPSTKMPKGETASSSQSARDKRCTEQQKLASLIGSSLFVLSVVASVFYIMDGQPIFPQQAARQSPASASVILGEYNNEVYTFKRKQKKIYAYNPTNKQERQICELAGLDTSFWYSASRIVLLSSAYNPKGGLYLLDLSQQPPPPEPELITNREADPYFPPDLSLESSLPLVWGTSGNIFAFVARDKEKNTQSLFIYDLLKKKLLKTPAENYERIADLVWINGDKELVFTAVNDSRENRYRVNSSGGNFSTWDAQP